MISNEAKILIIDDDPGVIFLHEIIIKESKLSNHPLCFSDAKKAIEYIITTGESSSKLLIFLDINMPKMSGWDFLDILDKNEQKADIKVVMVTSSLSKIDKEKAKEFPLVIDFWEKPINEIQSKKLKKRLGNWLKE